MVESKLQINMFIIRFQLYFWVISLMNSKNTYRDLIGSRFSSARHTFEMINISGLRTSVSLLSVEQSIHASEYNSMEIEFK